MNRKLRNTIVLAVSLLLCAAEAAAGGTVTVVQQLNGQTARCATVDPAVSGGKCTLTVTNVGAPYELTSVTAVKVISGASAQSRMMAPAVDTTPIAVTDDGNGVYSFTMPADAYDVVVTTDFGYRSFQLTVNGHEVRGDNLLDIFEMGDSTVAYNGNGVLILKNHPEAVSVVSALGIDLTVYIRGNANEVSSIATTGVGEKLIITTDPQNPGMLTLKAAEGKTVVVEGFSPVELKEGLVWRSGDETAAEAVVGTYIQPIVVETTVTPDGDKLDPDNMDDTDLVPSEENDGLVVNTVVDMVLYTLVVKDEEGNVVPVFTAEEDKTAVILNTSITENDMDNALNEEPGTDDFAKTFNGVTFKLAAGSGTIELDVEIPEGCQLNVRIGDSEPKVFTNYTGVISIPYVCLDATFVYVYNATQVPVEARGSFRAKIKTVPVKMYSVGVKPASVQQSPSPESEATANKTLSSAAISDAVDEDPSVLADGVFTLHDQEVSSLADDAFSDFDAGLTETGLSSIDLSQTTIRNVTVSRDSGPFKGVSKQTFIYLPVGNDDGGEPNVVIGAVCNRLELENSDKAFAPIMNFGAITATLGRDFVEGRTSTVYLPFDIDKATADELGFFYTFKGINAQGEADLELVTTSLVANTPYVFQKKAGGKITLSNASVKTEKPVTTMLLGTFQPIEWTSALLAEENAAGNYIYGFAAADQGTDIRAGEFVQVGPGAFIKPYRAYLKIHYDAARISINWGDDDDITGITNVKGQGSTAADVWFAIDGRRLKGAPVRPGLYIKNGKKTIVNLSYTE